MLSHALRKLTDSVSTLVFTSASGNPLEAVVSQFSASHYNGENFDACHISGQTINETLSGACNFTLSALHSLANATLQFTQQCGSVFNGNVPFDGTSVSFYGNGSEPTIDQQCAQNATQALFDQCNIQCADADREASARLGLIVGVSIAAVFLLLGVPLCGACAASDDSSRALYSSSRPATPPSSTSTPLLNHNTPSIQGGYGTISTVPLKDAIAIEDNQEPVSVSSASESRGATPQPSAPVLEVIGDDEPSAPAL